MPPVLREDGGLVQEPGYDRQTGLYLHLATHINEPERTVVSTVSAMTWPTVGGTLIPNRGSSRCRSRLCSCGDRGRDAAGHFGLS
jgi:hypothetical protein